jgi:hypothetical protein
MVRGSELAKGQLECENTATTMCGLRTHLRPWALRCMRKPQAAPSQGATRADWGPCLKSGCSKRSRYEAASWARNRKMAHLNRTDLNSLQRENRQRSFFLRKHPSSFENILLLPPSLGS